MSEEVRRMFSSIADRYDLINTMLSFGIHHRWRTKTVRLSGANEGMSVLDCATGTGDLALAFKKVVGDKGKVIGTDFSSEMINKAPLKAQKKKLDINWEVADAMNLPYEDGQFDISSIAFGIRNVDDPNIAVAEMARVVKPNGKVLILEFGQPKGWIKYPYYWHSKYVIPVIGGWISGNKRAYRYLPETSASFPADERFLEIMKETARFKAYDCTPLMQGIAYIYTGIVR